MLVTGAKQYDTPVGAAHLIEKGREGRRKEGRKRLNTQNCVSVPEARQGIRNSSGRTWVKPRISVCRSQGSCADEMPMFSSPETDAFVSFQLIPVLILDFS